jgi:hypothetical protein
MAAGELGRYGKIKNNMKFSELVRLLEQNEMDSE